MRSGRLDEAEPDVRRFKAMAERQMGDAAEAGDIAFGGEVDMSADTDANVRPPGASLGCGHNQGGADCSAAPGLLGLSDCNTLPLSSTQQSNVQKQLPLLLAMERMSG